MKDNGNAMAMCKKCNGIFDKEKDKCPYCGTFNYLKFKNDNIDDRQS